MAIVSKPQRHLHDFVQPDPMDFIERAAEQQTPSLSVAEFSEASKRRRKEPVIIRFDDYVLSKLDKAAAKRGLSRAALVRLLVMEHLPD
jgi:hypothetical protein